MKKVWMEILSCCIIYEKQLYSYFSLSSPVHTVFNPDFSVEIILTSYPDSIQVYMICAFNAQEIC
jgi:hypothetical protein